MNNPIRKNKGHLSGRILEILGILCLIACLTSPFAHKVSAAVSDIWAVPDPTDTSDSWRVTSAGHLLPGATNTYDVGSGAALLRNISASNATLTSIKTVPTTVSANGTLVGTPRLVYLSGFSGNITLNVTAPTAGSQIDFISTAGNLGVNGNVTLDAGAGNVINTARTYIMTNVTASNGTYAGLHMHGVNTTVWQANL